MQEYVLGFSFTADGSKVALIKKIKPAWQKDRWNGIGGKIEAGEMPHDAMVREFFEETGVSIITWNPLVKITDKHNFCIWVFSCQTDKTLQVKTVEEEEVKLVEVADISNYKHIENLAWIIPLHFCYDSGKPISVIEKGWYS